MKTLRDSQKSNAHQPAVEVLRQADAEPSTLTDWIQLIHRHFLHEDLPASHLHPLLTHQHIARAGIGSYHKRPTNADFHYTEIK